MHLVQTTPVNHLGWKPWQKNHFGLERRLELPKLLVRLGPASAVVPSRLK